MTFWQWLIGGGATTILGYLVWNANRSNARRTSSTSLLSAGAETWQEIARGLQADMVELKSEMKTMKAEFSKLEEDRDHLTEENRRFRSAFGDLMRWLAEWAAWEASGSKPPSPFTAAQILSRITILTEGLWKD